MASTAQSRPAAVQDDASVAASSLSTQTLCMSCSADVPGQREQDCCSSVCHLLFLPTVASLLPKDSLQTTSRPAAGLVAHGLDPPSVKRPPRS